MNRLPCPWGVSPVPAWGQVTDFTRNETPASAKSCSDSGITRVGLEGCAVQKAADS